MQRDNFIKINLLLIIGILLGGCLLSSCEGTDDSLSTVTFDYYSEMKENKVLKLNIFNIVAMSEQNQSMPLTEVSISIKGEIYEIKPYAPSLTFDIPSTVWPQKGDFSVLIQFYSNHGTAKTERSIWYFFSETPVFGINHVFNGTVECTTSWDSTKSYIAVAAPGTTSDYGEETTFYMVRSDDYTFKNEPQTDQSGLTLYDQWRFKMFTDLEIDYQNTNVKEPKITIESIVWDGNDANNGAEYILTEPRAEGSTDWIAAFGTKHTVKITYTCTGKMDGKDIKYTSTTDDCVIFAIPSLAD